jgi:polyisoprenoid-binding protein YceI
MKPLINLKALTKPLALLALITLSVAPGATAAPTQYTVQEGSQVSFKAASNLHGFNGRSTVVTGNVSYDPQDPLHATGEVIISATHLKTGDRKRDRGMRGNALEVKKYPHITMKMIRFVPSKTQTEAGKVSGNINGSLSLHGMEMRLVVPAVIEDLGKGELHVTGQVGIDMRNWGIRPPVTKMLFVSLRVLPNVSISFDLKLKGKPGANPQDNQELKDRLDRIEALKARLKTRE